jgi:hypothetical protein
LKRKGKFMRYATSILALATVSWQTLVDNQRLELKATAAARRRLRGGAGGWARMTPDRLPAGIRDC